MNQKDYFILGSKLLGIYCLVLSFSYLIGAVEVLIEPLGFPNDYIQAAIAIRIIEWLIPVFYISLGIYLIRKGSFLYNLIFPNQAASYSDLAVKFMLFQKLLGLYLLVTAFPNFLKMVSNFFIVFGTPDYMIPNLHDKFLYLNTLPSIATVALGYYLVKDGRLFLKWGFGNENAKPDSDRHNEKGTNE